MQHLVLDRDEGILFITLARGKANALNREIIDELQQALNHARVDERAHGVVLTSDTPKMFCGGFDVQEVFAYEREELTDFIGRFIRVFDTLRTLPKPTVAGINGHCYGGGSILALACDRRIMAEGDFQFSINLVNLGVVLPPRMVQALAAVVPGPTARQMFLEGHAWRSHEAELHGLVDELVPAGNIRHRSLTIGRQLASRPAGAYAAHKQALVEVSGGAAFTPDEIAAMAEAFATVWFDEECRDGRARFLERLLAARP